MNPITKALTDLRYRIPRRVLELAFLPKPHYTDRRYRSLVSVDYRIRDLIVNQRVMVDCDLVGGSEVAVPLYDVPPLYLPDNKVVWKIPLGHTNNRPITRVYSLVYRRNSMPVQPNFYAQGESIFDDLGSGLLATNMPIPTVSNADIELIGENTVVANTQIMQHPQLYLRCVIANDSEFNNLPDQAIHAFIRLVELATKSYIYNELYLDFDHGVLSGGMELGNLTSLIEGYADSETLYQEYLDEHWRKIAILADPIARKRHLKRVTGGRW